MRRGNLLVVSNNRFISRGLVQALTQDAQFVADEAVSTEAALELLRSGKNIDVIVVDAKALDGVADLKAIADQYPPICTVILVAGDNPLTFEQAAELNVRAVLPFSVSAEALNLTLQLVMLGDNLFLSPVGIPAETSFATQQPTQVARQSINLSKRESEILEFIRAGATDKVIAKELGVAAATVKVHVKSLFSKIRVGNRTQAAVWALNNL